MTTETRAACRIWRQHRSYSGEAPETGRRYTVYPEAIIHEDEHGGASVDCDQPVKATLVEVGAHWSDQPHGQAGWWVCYELDHAPTLDGIALPADRVR